MKNRHKILSILLLIVALSASTEALRVKCDFRTQTWTFGNAYTCTGSVLDNKDEETLEIANPEDHLPGLNNSHIGGLFFRNQYVNKIPLNIGWRFRNLRGLEFDNCNITDLRSSQLERLTNLIHFAIPRNRVRKIPGRYFRFTVKLQWVYLHNNQLSNAGLNVLKSLRELRGIYLANNGCINDNAVMDSRRNFHIMHSLMRNCSPDLDDFVRDTEESECTFTDNTSNENPPKSSSSKKTKESLLDEFWGFRE